MARIEQTTTVGAYILPVRTPLEQGKHNRKKGPNYVNIDNGQINYNDRSWMNNEPNTAKVINAGRGG